MPALFSEGRETLSAASKAVSYPSITFENIAQNKRQSMSHCQDVQKCAGSMKNGLPRETCHF